jgi:hypothetical protein
MSNMCEIFIKSIWIPFFARKRRLKKSYLIFAFGNATILVMIVVCPNDTSMEAEKLQTSDNYVKITPH